MRRLKVLVVAVVATLAISLAAAASPGSQGRPAVPSGAVEVAEDVYYLGKRNVDGREVEGLAFVHRARSGSTSRKPGGAGSCFTYLASGAKWKSAEPWLVDDSQAPISEMASLMVGDVATWEKWIGSERTKRQVGERGRS